MRGTGSLTTALLVLAAIAGASPCTLGKSAGSAAGDPAATINRQTPFAVYYLHGERRCRTCLSIEDTAERIIRSDFREQLERGTLSWASLNYDLPANRHFVEDFGLVSSSLVLVARAGAGSERFKVLDQTWPLSRDEVRFRAYLIREIREFLAQGS